MHLTEYAYERQHQHGDRTWTGFANMLQHRLAVLFYRAWANAQSITSLDKNAEDRFGKYIASFNGLDTPTIHNKRLNPRICQTLFCRSADETEYGRQPISTTTQPLFQSPRYHSNHVGYWVEVAEEKTQIGIMGNYTLGDGLLLGDKLYDVQSKIPVSSSAHLPYPLTDHSSKTVINTARLREWVRLFAADEYEWDIQPVLMQKEVPLMDLGGRTQLGLTTWLGNVSRDAEDLIVSNH